MRKEHYAGITKVVNGYTVSIAVPVLDKDDWDNREEYVFSTFEEALEKVKEYFSVQ